MKVTMRIIGIVFLSICSLVAIIMLITKFYAIGIFFFILAAIFIIPIAISKETPADYMVKNIRNNNDFSISVTYLEGLPNLIPKTFCGVFMNNATADILHIQPLSNASQLINLPVDKIVNIGIVSEAEIIQRNKNVIGRSVAGGLLFGSVGAIVGGLSGTQTAKEIVPHHFLIINYMNKDGTVQVLSFEVNASAFNKPLNSIVNIIKGRIKPQVMTL